MAINTKIESTADGKYLITVGFEKYEIPMARNPRELFDKVEYQIACAIAQQILKELSPAISEAIKKAFPSKEGNQT